MKADDQARLLNPPVTTLPPRRLEPCTATLRHARKTNREQWVASRR